MSTASRKIRLIMQLRRAGIADTDVLSAMEKIPREAFVPDSFLDQAYENHALPIGHGQTLSQPQVVAMMTQALKVDRKTKVLEVVAANPELKYIIVDAAGINQLDATGEEVLYQLAELLRANGIELLVAQMKKQFMDTIRRTNVIEKLGEDHFFSRVQFALNYAWDQLGDEYDRNTCPLRLPAM